ncbi:MAG: lipopolysaccharide biosynthesis protein [Desulfuromonadales bacterium]
MILQKYQHIFDTSHLQDDLKKKSLRSGAVTLTSQGLQFVIQLGSTMILARILSPADYGINGMAVAITGFAAIFSNLGLSTATIQRAEINHEQVSSLFWINSAIGLLLTLLVAAISPLAAWFYKTPEMFEVMLSLSIIFAITGLTVQHSALLTRQMRFYTLAKIHVLSMLAGILVAIFAGFQGFGYWALVFNTLTNVAFNTLGCWLACRWVPGMPKRGVGVGTMIKFGADLVSFDVVNYFARNLDNILIGRFLGAATLGLYSKAYQLLMMPITNLRSPITSVAMPALSRLQTEPEKYRDYYLKCVSLLAFVSMPLVAFMFVCSDQLITLLLGSQWLGASVLFKILAVAAFIQPVSGTAGMVLISTGQSRLYLKLGLVSSVFICLSFVLGLPWGAKGVATGYAIINYVLLVPVLFYTFKNTAVNIKDFLSAIIKPLIASIAMALGCFELLVYTADLNIFYVLTIGFLSSSIIYLVVFSVMPSGCKSIQEYFSYGLLLFERKG